MQPLDQERGQFGAGTADEAIHPFDRPWVARAVSLYPLRDCGHEGGQSNRAAGVDRVMVTVILLDSRCLAARSIGRGYAARPQTRS